MFTLSSPKPCRRSRAAEAHSRRRQRRRLLFEGLENRTLLATFAEASSLLNLDMNVANTAVGIVSGGTSYALTLTGDTWSGPDSVNVTGNGTTTLSVTTAGLGVFDTVNISDSATASAVAFNNSGANSYGDTFNISLDSAASTFTFNGASSFTETAALSASTSRNIVFSSGAIVSTFDGNLTLSANQQFSPTSGNFIGIDVNGGTVQVTGAGNLTLTGRGGDDIAGEQRGVYVHGGGVVQVGSSGSLAVIGTGGNSPVLSGLYNHGVSVANSNSRITSSGGNVAVTGIGGGVGASVNNYGVEVVGAGEILAGGSGTVTVVGTGGNTAGSGSNNRGVYITGAGSQVTSSGGNVSVTGVGGGAGSSGSNHAVVVENAAQITAAGGGSVTVSGSGGNTTGTEGNSQFGVYVFNSQITSSGGDVSVTGIGGGAGTSGNNLGVVAQSGGKITAGGNGSVTVTGTGGNALGTGSDNRGVWITGTNSQITSSGGLISVTGTGGGGASSFGIQVASAGGIIGTTGAPTVSLTADSMDLASTVSVQAGANMVVLRPKTLGTRIDLGGADVLSGSPLTLGLSDAELDRITAGVIAIGSGGAGPITVSDFIQPALTETLQLITGSSIGQTVASGLQPRNLALLTGGNVNLGIAANNVETLAVSSGGNVVFAAGTNLAVGEVAGQAGVVAAGSILLSTTAGDLTVNNTSQAQDVSGTSISLWATGNDRTVRLASGAHVQSASVIGVNADEVDLQGTMTAVSTRVSFETQDAVLLGPSGDTTPGALELSDAELDRITAPSIQIGGLTAAAITISSAINPGGTSTLHLISGGTVSQSAPLTVAALAITANGTITLTDSGNAVDRLAAFTPLGHVLFTDRDAIEVTSVDARHGVAASNGGVILTTVAGDLTISNTPNSWEVKGNTVRLQAGGAERSLGMAAGARIDTQTGGWIPAVTTELYADKMQLDGEILAGGASVALATTTAGVAINLGSTADAAANTLELSDAELDRISAHVLQVGNTSAGAINISQAINPAAVNTVYLVSNSTVSQSAPLTVSNLAVQAGGSINLNAPTNDVDEVALRGTAVDFQDVDDLSVGEVQSLPGIVATNGNVWLFAGGDVTIQDTSAPVEMLSNFTVNIIVLGTDERLLVLTGARVESTMAGGFNTFRADTMQLEGSLVAQNGLIALLPLSDGKMIDLGSMTDNTANTLELSDAELDRVTADTLRIGSSVSGAIRIVSDLHPAGVDTLRLSTGGGITQTAPLSIANLAIAIGAAESVMLSDAANDVDALSAQGGSLVFRDADDLRIGTVDFLNGLQFSNGNVELTSVMGSLTVSNTPASEEIRANFFRLTAGGTDGLLTLDNGTNLRILNVSGELVANKMILNGTISAAGKSITLRPFTAGYAINLGSTTDLAPNTLELSDAELDRILAGTIRVGHSTAGNVTISAPISRADSAMLEIVSGGTIGDTSVSAPDVTVSRLTLIGTVAPGMSPGILSVAGDFVFADNDVFQVEIGGATPGTNNNNHDQLAATGSVTIGDNVTLSVSSWMGFSPTVVDSYTIIERTGGAGTFAGLPEGATITNFLGSGRNATITYTGGDGDDVVLTQEICVTNTNDSGAGSLRQAILNANASPGIDDICFNIPGSGPHTIHLLSALPTINDPVVLDGTTEPNFAGTPVIELDGSGAGAGVIGLNLVTGASGSTIRGMVVNRFGGGGMSLANSTTLEGNFIGTDVTGSLDRGNGGTGVRMGSFNLIGGTTVAARNLISGNRNNISVDGNANQIQGNIVGTNLSGTAALGIRVNGVSISGSDNLIGGTIPAARNLISGNRTGVFISGIFATGNIVQGNFIGTDHSGTNKVANSGAGVFIGGGSSHNTIGGDAERTGNVISGNDGMGVWIASGASHNTVQRNLIGTDPLGTMALGNVGQGVLLDKGGSAAQSVNANLIVENTIAFNEDTGIAVSEGTENRLSRNSIYANFRLGIDLAYGVGGLGVTLNDAGDADVGANNLQNFPVISSSSPLPSGGTEVNGSLNSMPNTTFTLEFFYSPAADPSSFGEGKTHFGTAFVTTNASGDVSFSFGFGGTTVPDGQFITATATDPSGNTSEFSRAIQVISNQPPTADAGGPYTVGEGGSVQLDASHSSDPDQAHTTLIYQWDLDGDNIFGEVGAAASRGNETGMTPSFSAAGLDGLSSVTVSLRVTDNGGLMSTDSATTTITNVAPHDVIIAASVGELVFAVGSSQPFSGSFKDVGTADTHTSVWTFTHLDATGVLVTETRAGTVNEVPGSGIVSDSFSFAEAGVYQVKLTVTDDDTGTTSSLASMFVIYDPSAGFVTGGGWITSPEGADLANPTATGKANFGFVSQYKKGATTPTGQTEFQFQAGNLNFQSASYEWLVVAGARAQYKGVGTINGSGNYGFMLTAIDGQVSGGGGVDKFRIKIWDKVSGGLRYDNQFNADENTDLTTALGGGQIVIHSGGKNLVATGSETASAPGTVLTQTRLDSMLGQAVEYWSSQGLDPHQLSQLRDLDIQVGSFPGNTLGMASTSTNLVWIDADAAGYGWSFSTDDPRSGRVDLLSTLTHELGHVLGLDHDVMGESLAVGVRTLPALDHGYFQVEVDGLGNHPETNTRPLLDLFPTIVKNSFSALMPRPGNSLDPSSSASSRDHFFARLAADAGLPFPALEAKVNHPKIESPPRADEDLEMHELLLDEDLIEEFAMAQLRKEKGKGSGVF